MANKTDKTRKTPGLKTLMRRVSARGMSAVDRRSTAYKAMKAWCDAMIQELGGEQQITRQRRSILELAAREKLFLDHADSFLMELPTPINRRSRKFIPLVLERQRIADSFVKHLQVLGLERVCKDLGALPESMIERVRRPVEPEADPSPREQGS